MMTRFLQSGALAVLALAGLLGTAHAANEGRAVAVDPAASARAGAAERTLVVGADVSVGERIVTGPSGQVQLVFVDDTRLVVGPGSSLLIESYLMRGGGSAERFAVDALAGTFRFISGNSPSAAYEIRTPSATIGIRGTEFDFIVGASETRVMLYRGAVRICATSGNCADLVARCDIASATSATAAVIPHANPARDALVRPFRYAQVQTPLLPPFRVSGANGCYVPPPPDSVPQSLGPGSSNGRGSVPPPSPDNPDQQGPNQPGNPTTPPPGIGPTPPFGP